MNREDRVLINKYIWMMVSDTNSRNEYFPLLHSNLADLSSGEFGAIIIPRVNANDFIFYEEGDWIRIALTYRQIAESTSIDNIGVYDRDNRRTLSCKEASFFEGYQWVLDSISTFPNDVERSILKFNKFSRVVDWYSYKYLASGVPKRGLYSIDTLVPMKHDMTNKEADRIGLARRDVANFVKVQFKEAKVV